MLFFHCGFNSSHVAFLFNLITRGINFSSEQLNISTVKTTMALSREYRWIPIDVYRQCRQLWSDITFVIGGRPHPAHAERIR